MMINILVPYNSRYYVKDAYISRLSYFGSHYEVTLHSDGRNVLMVFGRRKDGCFVYFPAFEEGINLSFQQSNQEAVEKISFLFDGSTSAAIVATVKQFLRMEGGQKWYRKASEHPKQERTQQAGLPF